MIFIRSCEYRNIEFLYNFHKHIFTSRLYKSNIKELSQTIEVIFKQLQSYILSLLNNSTEPLRSKYSYFTIIFFREMHLHTLSTDVSNEFVRSVLRYCNSPSPHKRRGLYHSSQNPSLRKTSMHCTDPWMVRRKITSPKYRLKC